MKRNRKRRRASSGPVQASRLRIITVAELQHVSDQLAAAGTDPIKQQAAISLALTFKDAYYYAGKHLRRCFPKKGEVVEFSSITPFSGKETIQ